jgi:hypothetical protein
MFLLFIILGYILPIICFYITIYIRMESGQTILNYIDKHDLDEISIFIWIPLFNIIVSIGLVIFWYSNLIENIKKP